MGERELLKLLKRRDFCGDNELASLWIWAGQIERNHSDSANQNFSMSDMEKKEDRRCWKLSAWLTEQLYVEERRSSHTMSSTECWGSALQIFWPLAHGLWQRPHAGLSTLMSAICSQEYKNIMVHFFFGGGAFFFFFALRIPGLAVLYRREWQIKNTLWWKIMMGKKKKKKEKEKESRITELYVS